MNVINYSLAILLRNQSLQEVSITREGDEAILKEVVSPGLIAANTCVDMMCVSIIRVKKSAKMGWSYLRPSQG